MTEIADILRRIVDRRRDRIADAVPSGWELSLPDASTAGGTRFTDALRSAAGHAVIAEVKMGSPRLGSLQTSLVPERQVRLYRNNGAAAISVVVEPEFFDGSYELLTLCSEASGLPVLAKDFIVHPIQLEWARVAGASAVLLIAAILTQTELVHLAHVTRRLGMVPLVECHGAEELDRLGLEKWEMVGVNNRDLRTFEVSLERSVALIPKLPVDTLKVAESGIRSGEDVAKLSRAGFDAFLVGETLLLADDPGARLRELVGSGSR